MSAPEERGALTSVLPLYLHALRLHRAAPDGPLPDGGSPLPHRARPGPPERDAHRRRPAARPALRAALLPLLAGPDPARAAEEVHRRLPGLGVPERQLARAVAELPLEDEAAARALGRRLTRTGTGTAAVHVGLALLARVGEPEDVPYLKVLGLLRVFTEPVVEALTALGCPTSALVWLGDRVSGRQLQPLITALTRRDGPAARRWLLAVPLGPRAVWPSTARTIAEAVRLPDALRQEPIGPGVLAQAGRLLARMTVLGTDVAEILAYRQAVAGYEALIVRAGQLPPTLDHFALLLALALDLHSGPSVLLDWRPGQRAALLDSLESVLRSPRWSAVLTAEPAGPAARRRIRWARSATHLPFGRPTEPARLRVEVTVGDPAAAGPVETRILIDGRPLVPEAFGLGPAHSPEYLLDTGRLRAAAEPHPVQLSEASCTEGCCGALQVTIHREGDQVVWGDWRRPAQRPSLPPRSDLPVYRFDAAAYDAEIARAERDRSWSWPARSAARLLTEGLRDRPGLLTRWDARLGWVGTDFTDPDTTVLSFVYWPGLAAGRQDRDGPWLQFVWRIPEDGTPPQERADAALSRLATTDPKAFAEVTGGRSAYAEALGFPWSGSGDRE
ncbi:hypothetical protein [Streptomyces sp. NPDC020742]|uniref:hypothetical protein n=1 Tax=Streptomyces sp. NPDC020742 TaxID=3154897 RepID=UPI003402537C